MPQLIGWVIYDSYWFLQIVLTGHLLKYRKIYPAFFSYSLYCCLRSAILFPLFLTSSVSRQTYADLYWAGRYIEIVFLAWIVAGLLGHFWIVAVGALMALSQVVHFRLAVERWYGIGVCAVLLLILAFRKLNPHQRAIASGLLVATLFHAILMVPKAFGHPVWKFIPTVATIAAIVIWLDAFWLRDYRAREA